MTDEAPKRILLVDDDPTVADLLRRTFPECEVAAVGSAEAAIATAEAFRPDLFVLDLILPGMRGPSLAGLFRETPVFAQTPIFLISGLIEGAPDSEEPVRVNGLPAFPKPLVLPVLKKHALQHMTGPLAAAAATALLQPGRITRGGLNVGSLSAISKAWKL